MTVPIVGRRAIERRRGAFDVHDFVELPDLHLQVELEVLPDLEPHLIVARRFESGQLGHDRLYVSCRRKEVEDVHARCVRNHVARQPRGSRFAV